MIRETQAHKKWKAAAAAVWNFWTSKTGAFILGVSGIVFGYYIFYISRPILKYETEKVTFISSANENDYAVSVHGKNYQDLYMTRIYLHNKGAMALSGNDVSKIGHDPIRITVPKDAKLVHYTLDHTATTDAITSKLEKADDGLVIEFDYLNPDYQIAASLLHENPDAEFTITGSALNVNEITREWSDKTIKSYFLWSLGILYLILLLIYIYNHRKHKNKR